jgi:hypothetical protein
LTATGPPRERLWMSKLQLPSRAGDTWDGGFIFDQVRDVKAVEARGGLVVAGGADLYLLKPADESWKVRPPPEDIGPVHAVAAEPRGARRYAVASEKMFALFMKTKQGDQILRLKPQVPGGLVTHLAWGGVKGPCALWVRHDDGMILRMKPDLSDLEDLAIEEIAALASDDTGVVALAAVMGEYARVYVTRDGVEMAHRPLPDDIGPDTSLEIAVADTAVAVVVDQERVLLSRGLEDPFLPVEAVAIPDGKGWRMGPIAFQGAASDAALFCARWESDVVRIVRVDPSGAAMSIAEMGGSETTDAPEIDALSWDASRHTLWGAGSSLGILRSVAPSAKGKKKPVLS